MRPRSRGPRGARRWGLVGAAVLALLAAGCSGSPETPAPGEPPPNPRASGLPEACSTTVTDPATAPGALAGAQPGDTVCFTGTGLAGLEIDMRVSGTADRPISLIADGTTMRTIGVTADYVVVDGFTLVDGDGLNMEGTGLVARNNVVRNAADDGIVCADCRGATIESNTVWRTDGTGLIIDGENSVVRRNTISDSVKIKEGDADGMRFFGNGLRITDNTIKDIKASGYPEREAPHTDCFQTYRGDARPTYDVIIANNTCENVDVQCLIATGNGSGRLPTSDAPTIRFENNTCTVNGSQAVLLEDFPNVLVSGNTFTGPEYRAVFLARGSTNCSVLDNIVVGDIPAFEIDDDSRSGFRAEGNTSR